MNKIQGMGFRPGEIGIKAWIGIIGFIRYLNSASPLSGEHEVFGKTFLMRRFLCHSDKILSNISSLFLRLVVIWGAKSPKKLIKLAMRIMRQVFEWFGGRAVQSEGDLGYRNNFKHKIFPLKVFPAKFLLSLIPSFGIYCSKKLHTLEKLINKFKIMFFSYLS